MKADSRKQLSMEKSIIAVRPKVGPGQGQNNTQEQGYGVFPHLRNNAIQGVCASLAETALFTIHILFAKPHYAAHFLLGSRFTEYNPTSLK